MNDTDMLPGSYPHRKYMLFWVVSRPGDQSSTSRALTWIQCKLGKQYLVKKFILPWESNPGPTPIWGGPASILASVGLKIEMWNRKLMLHLEMYSVGRLEQLCFSNKPCLLPPTKQRTASELFRINIWWYSRMLLFLLLSVLFGLAGTKHFIYLGRNIQITNHICDVFTYHIEWGKWRHMLINGGRVLDI